MLDRADPRLGVAREARHVNRKELETNLRQWVLKLRQLGASDASQVCRKHRHCHTSDCSPCHSGCKTSY